MYKSFFDGYKSYLKITDDKEWKAYREFLYPNEEALEYMENNKVLINLMEKGDNLAKARQVDHWIYFKNPEDRSKFEAFVKAKEYNIVGKDKLKDNEYPYQLHISRIDVLDHNTINTITIELKKKAKEFNGDYDGWETFVVKE
jgi:regulator of RNase E activity RraB